MRLIASGATRRTAWRLHSGRDAVERARQTEVEALVGVRVVSIQDPAGELRVGAAGDDVAHVGTDAGLPLLLGQAGSALCLLLGQFPADRPGRPRLARHLPGRTTPGGGVHPAAGAAADGQPTAALGRRPRGRGGPCRVRCRQRADRAHGLPLRLRRGDRPATAAALHRARRPRHGRRPGLPPPARLARAGRPPALHPRPGAIRVHPS